MNPQALIAVIKINMLRRPLWKVSTVTDCMDLSRSQVLGKIEDGSLPYAFDLGNSKLRVDPRILALSVIELQLGEIPAIGASRNLQLPEVMDLILPKRDVRSTELKKILGINNESFRGIQAGLIATRKPDVNDGPNSYTIFQRASVAGWLSKRRMI